MSATQRSAVLLAPGRVEVREVPIPEPGPGQVLLRIERALAGGTDRKAFVRGHPQIPMPGPFGHRYVGTVARLGPGAQPVTICDESGRVVAAFGSTFEVGQPVMGVHSAPCLVCSFCRKELWHLCPDVMKEKVLGAFAQYLCIPAPVARQNLFPRPASMPLNHAALLEPLACVVHGLEMIQWRGIERVLLLGLGSMGLLFAQLLRHYTQAPLVVAGRRPARRELARQLGLDVAPGDDPPATLFDCVLECTGTLAGWQTALERTAPGGQVLLFGGLPRGTQFTVDSYRLHYEELRILGCFHFSPRDVARAREFLLAGGLQLDPLISGVFPLDRLPEAMACLERGEGLQYAIDPWA